LPEQALKLAEQGKAQLPASVVERINDRLRWAQAIYSEDVTYAKGAYRLQTKTQLLPKQKSSSQDSSSSSIVVTHKSNTKNLKVFLQVTGLFLTLVFCKEYVII